MVFKYVQYSGFEVSWLRLRPWKMEMWRPEGQVVDFCEKLKLIY